MKKLMFAAFAAAVTSGAFAAPLVYDYKASVKHMNLKTVNVRWNGETTKVYQKYVKSASLKGYLIVDADGATSQTIIADKIVSDPAFSTGAWANGTPATGVDFGRNRAFLVVMNTKAERQVRTPKLIPAVLDAKWLDTKFRLDRDGAQELNKTGLAEGYLYAGGDFGVATRSKLDRLYSALATYDAGVTSRAATNASAMIGDYVWQSLWLFGRYNMPNVANTAAFPHLQNVVQAAIDTGADGANLPLTNAYTGTPQAPFFHDSWMNGAGFGKYALLGDAEEICCGLPEDQKNLVLQSLSGNLKGGLFLCTENGTIDEEYDWYQGSPLVQALPWEDQFFCARLLVPADYAGDTYQLDLWQDGQLELNTTDCVSGTWSIKRTTRDIAVAITQADLNNGLGLAVPTTWAEDAPGLTDLLSTIKGAAQRLDRNAVFASNTNIYNIAPRTLGRIAAGYAENTVPMLTPAFAAYYGFLNFK